MGREIEVTDTVLAELGLPSLAELERKKGFQFVKGPIPLEWVIRADVAAHTLAVALVIKALVDMRGEPVATPQEAWQRLGLARGARKRALDALERAGVVRTERLPGKSTRIWLIDKP